MTDDEKQGRVPQSEPKEPQSGEPLESPGGGYGTEETLPEESEPSGKLNLDKDDVGFGPKGDEDTAQ